MPDSNTFNLTAYSPDLRWIGQGAVPSHRRLSDFVNDTATAALVLNQATPATWENNWFNELPKTESIALPKRNLLFVVSKSEPPLPPHSKLERIPKQRFPVILYVPPFSMMGRISLPSNTDWLNLVASATENFFPVIDASIWHIKARAKVESDIPLVLVNWKWLLGMEPKR
jgi:hypothetical protein